MAQTRTQNTNNNHIQSVQGLRALAVIAVLLFHAKITVVSGGFIGVDVFFVISGYVITLLLRKRLAAGNFSFAEFYQRRAWRLIPALTVTLFLTAIVFGFLMPSSESPQLFISIIAAAFAVSNFYFNQTLDYFDSGITNPVLHTWSLGIEEQFYLAFPLLLWLLYGKQISGATSKLRQFSAGLIIFAIVLFGFGVAAYQTSLDQSSAFYLPWFRAWEFLSGAAIAFVNTKHLSQSLTKAASWLGILLLLPLLFLYDEHMVFPGFSAALPVIATMLILLGAKSQNGINTLLASTPMRLIGNGSYSIYLLHWPVICFIGLFISLDNPKTQAITILMSLVLGFLSWYFVEEKFRHGLKPLNGFKKPLVPVLLMLSSACFVLIAMFSTNLFWDQHPQAKTHFAHSTKHLHLFRGEQCFMVQKPVEQFDTKTCLSLSEDKENVLVTGDSLAANMVMSLQQKWPEKNFLQATAQNYVPGNYFKWTPLAKSLDKVVDGFYQKNYQHINTFIFFALWQREDLTPLIARIKALKDAGHKVIVLGPSPQLYIGSPVILAHSDIFNYNLAKHLFKNKRYQLDTTFKQALTPLVDEYISTYDILCKQGQCDLELQDQPLFFDDVHLTKMGTEYLANHL